MRNRFVATTQRFGDAPNMVPCRGGFQASFGASKETIDMNAQPNAIPPKASASTVGSAPSGPRLPRSLAASRGASWWSEGWNVFVASPWLWIAHIVVLGAVLVVLAFIPVLGNIAGSLLAPVLLGGMLVGCQALARGQPLQFDHLFAGFRDGRTVPLVLLGLFAFVAGLAIALLLMSLVFGAMGISTFTSLMTGNASAVMNGAMAGMGVAAVLAVPIAFLAWALFIMAWFFAPALCALDRVEAFTAIRASLRASWANLGAIVLFVVIFVVLALLASIPAFLGWLVLGPVAVGASFAAWREVFSE
jgi:hypothetical protein